MEYTWSDSSALYQMRYYNDDTVKGMSAETYLKSRLEGKGTLESNLAAKYFKKKNTPVNQELFNRTAPKWNCVDYPDDGPHYLSSYRVCQWCGETVPPVNGVAW